MRMALLFLPFLLVACGGGVKPLAEGETLRVMAASPALACMALAIAGDDANVEMLAPEDAGAHDYEPSVADRRRLEASHILLINGLGLESFNARSVARAARATLVDCSAQIPKAWLLQADEEEDHDHGHSNSHGNFNPHVWLSTEGAIYQAQAIADAFAGIDAANAQGYRSRFEALKTRLEALSAEYKPKVAALEKRRFVSNHDAFPYFAREFGLTQAGVIQRTPGHNPTVEQRRALERQIAEGGAHAIFMEPGYDDAASQAIAANSGLPLAVLDPFDTGKPGPDALENKLRENLETVLKTLGGGD